MNKYFFRDEALRPKDSETVFFDFDKKALARADQLIPQKGPFIAGIHGEWGAGKTTFCNYLATYLENKRQCVVRYNAWRYQNDEYPVIPLLSHLAADEKVKQFLGEAYGALKDLLSSMKLNITANNVLVGKASLGMDFNRFLEGRYRNQAVTLKKRIESFFAEHAVYSGYLDKLREALEFKDRSIFIFIDDMDRCNPDKALFLLEQIKLVLDLPHCIFILALNEKALDGFVRKRYSEELGLQGFTVNEYIEKLIQLRIYLGRAQPDEMKQFVDYKIKGSILEEYGPSISDIVVQGAIGNPRSALRILNQIASKNLDAEAIKLQAREEAIRVAAPEFLKEVLECRLSLDYVRFLIDEGDIVALEDFISEFTLPSRVGPVRSLCTDWVPQWSRSGKKVSALVHEERKSQLFDKEKLNKPSGHLRIIDLARYYFDNIENTLRTREEDLENSLQPHFEGLGAMLHNLRRFGDYQAISDFCLSLLKYIRDRLTEPDPQFGKPAGKFIQWTLQEGARTGIRGLTKDCTALCRTFTEALPEGLEHLNFKRHQLFFERLGPEMKPLQTSRAANLKIFLEYRSVLATYLQTNSRESGELFALGVELDYILNGLLDYSTPEISEEEGLQYLAFLHSGVDRDWYQKNFDSLTHEENPKLYSWLGTLLAGEPSDFADTVAKEKKRLKNAIKHMRADSDDLASGVGEDHRRYLRNVLRALATKNQEFAAIFDMEYLLEKPEPGEAQNQESESVK